MDFIVRRVKKTGEKTLVGPEEFLGYVGSGKKRREEALSELLQGGLFQDMEVSFYVEELREKKQVGRKS